MSLRAQLIVITLLALPLTSSASCFDFGKTLKESARDGDVIELQKVLNQDPQTRVARSGPGSPGHEISTFGHATTLALMRFQERYRNAILAPQERKNPTGIADELTRKKLSELSCATTTTSPKPVVSTAKVHLDAASTYQVRVGDTITLTGKGLSKDTTVSIGGSVAQVLAGQDSSISFIIPEDSPLGVTQVTAKNSLGKSNNIELFIGRAGKNIQGLEACLDITRTLRTNDEGSDILLLARFLNSDTRTKIAEAESRTYTSAVSDAVSRFQKLYSKDILIPAKLAAPTGIVSLFTADKIREITCGSKKLTQEQKDQAAAEIKKVDKTPTEKAIEDTIAKRKQADQDLDTLLVKNQDWYNNMNEQYFSVKISSASVAVSSSTETYTLYGSHFTPTNNTVFVCDKLIAKNVEAPLSYQLTFSTSPGLRPSDSCAIAVSNANGESDPAQLKVTKPINLTPLPLPTPGSSSEDYQALLKSLGY